MRQRTSSRAALAVATALACGTPAAAVAGCFADYKAKQDNPLRLHYGVIQLSDGACGNPAQAAAEIGPRIAAEGWQLLQVMGTFGDDGLDGRRESAGSYFLRY